MIPWDTSKEELLKHLNYQIRKMKEIANVPLYSHLKSNVEEYIKKVEYAIKDINESNEGNLGSLDLEDYGISYGYNDTNFIANIKKNLGKNNFINNRSIIVCINTLHRIGEIKFTKEEKSFLDKISFYMSDEEYGKLGEIEDSDVSEDDEKTIDDETDIAMWVVHYFSGKIFTEEELVYIIKNRKSINETILIGEEQRKKDNAFFLFCKDVSKESLTKEQIQYVEDLQEIAHMYYEDKDILIDYKYVHKIFHLITDKEYSVEDIVELSKTSTAVDWLRVNLILELNKALVKIGEIEKPNFDKPIETRVAEEQLVLKWKILFNDCTRGIYKALDMLD